MDIGVACLCVLPHARRQANEKACPCGSRQALGAIACALVVNAAWAAGGVPPPGDLTPDEAWTGHAVIVGVSEYPGSHSPLEYARDDAQDLRTSLLLDPVHWQAENMALLVDAAATKEAISSAIKAMGDAAGPEDVCLFFYAGHGDRSKDRPPLDEADGLDEYLSTYTEWVRDDEIADWFSGFRSRGVCLILDSCSAGGAMRTAVQGSADGEDYAAEFAAELDLAGRDRRAGGRGLRDDRPTEVVALAACGEAGSSFSSPSLRNGVFSFFVSEALWQPDTDTNGDGWLSAEEVFAYAAPRTTEYSPDQVAALYDSHSGELPVALAAARSYGSLEDALLGGGGCDADICEASTGRGATTVMAILLLTLTAIRRVRRAKAAILPLLALLAVGCPRVTVAPTALAGIGTTKVGPARSGDRPARPSRSLRGPPFLRAGMVVPVSEEGARYRAAPGVGLFASFGRAGRRWEIGLDAMQLDSPEAEMEERMLAARIDLLWGEKPISRSHDCYLLTGSRVYYGTAKARWGEIWEIAAAIRLGIGIASARTQRDLQLTCDICLGSNNLKVLVGLAAGMGF